MMFDDLKYAQRERLIYLDQCFAWRGTANRSDLIERFGVSTAQAALDFKAYIGRAKQSPPLYDAARKTYLAADPHVSLCPERLFHNWQGILSEEAPERFDELPKLNRQIDVNIVSKLYQAMTHRKAIQIKYVSMTTGNEDAQWIAPTCFASEGERLHFRGYSYKHKEYRDYIPVRIGRSSSFKTRSIGDDFPPDNDWNTIVQIHLVPKSSLSQLQQKAVRREYGFTGPTLCIETRKALEFYTDRRWGLDRPNARLERHSTIILDAKEK
ncbi:MAG: hypothetical protein ACPGVT_12955 [Maricaulaceae bacterium]